MPTQSALPIPVYIISLARATERRENITHRLTTAGIDYEIIDAVDGKTLDLHSLQDRIKIKNPQDDRGMIGCYLSHYSVWHKMVNEQTPFAVILEDDAVWDSDSDFVEVCGKLPQVDWHWDVVQLFYRKRIRADFHLCNIGAHRLVRTYRPTSSAIGYMVTQQCAQKLLTLFYEIRMPVDGQMNRYWQMGLAYYSIAPQLGYQSGVPSTIGALVRESVNRQNAIDKLIAKYRRLEVKIRRAVYHYKNPPTKRQ